MFKKGRFIFFALLLGGLLSGCISNLWTGASLVYDRHDVYKKLHDYHLLVDINNALYVDKTFKNERCVLDITAFNEDILLAGHVPSEEMLYEILHRLRKITGYRHLYNEIKVSQSASNTVQDTWITTKIRSQIFADDSIDPNAFKIITSDGVVYIMGDVRRQQAERVIKIARLTKGVLRVVKILNYFTYQTKGL
jgi:osmotically-inducible protein OsmY